MAPSPVHYWMFEKLNTNRNSKKSDIRRNAAKCLKRTTDSVPGGHLKHNV